MELTGKKALMALGALIFAFGLYSAVMQGLAFHRDYRDFRVMRGWVGAKMIEERRQKEAQAQRQAPQAQPQQAPAAPPKGVPQ